MENKANIRPERVGLSLQRNFSWMLVGNVFYAICHWAMLVVIAKTGNPEMVGRFVLGLAISAPVIMFSNLNLRLVLATDPREKYSFFSYLALRLITAPAAALVVAGIALFAGYPGETALVVIFVGIAKAFEATSEIYYGLFQMHERLDRVSKSLILKGILSLLLLGAGVYFTKNILWGAVGLAVATALTLTTYDLGSARFVMRLKMGGNEHAVRTALTPRWNGPLLWKLALLTLPLGVMVLLQSLNANIPRFFIQSHLGEHALGIFGALAYVIVAGTVVVRAFGQSVSPIMARLYAEGKIGRFSRFVGLLVLFGAVIGLGGVGVSAIAGRWILRIIYTPEYSNYGALFTNIMFAALFLYIALFLDYGATIVRNFRAQMALSIIYSSVTLILCLWLIPRAGLHGASSALLGGAVTKVVGNLVVLGTAIRDKKRELARGKILWQTD